jgi:predicted  nucleic acid-binding Zn-ribbon protein
LKASNIDLKIHHHPKKGVSMKHNFTKITALFLACLATSVAHGQHMIGMQAGNHNASYAYALNPSLTYPSKNRLYVNFWGAGIGFTNNALTYSAPFSLWQLGAGTYPDKYKNASGKLDFNQDWLTLNKNTDNWKLYYLDETYGPSMQMRLTNRLAFGVGIKGVAGLSVTGLNKELGNLFRFGLDSNGNGFNGVNATELGKKYDLPKFSANTDKWQEWFFSLAGVTRDKGPHFTKWGFTGKLLLGFGASHLGVNGGSYSFNNNNQVQFNNLQSTWFHTNDRTASNTLGNPIGMKFDFLEGAGLGTDLGFTYEYRPSKGRKRYNNPWFDCDDESENEYKWRLGASLTDLGFIAYGGQGRMVNYKDASATWNINRNLLNTYQFSGEDRFEKISNGFYDSLGADVTNNFITTTPAAFNMQFDRRYSGNFHLGINWTHSLKGNYTWGVRRASYLSFIPRWESEHAELGMPVTFTRDYTALNIGVYGRLGPVTIGTDNFSGLMKYASKGEFTGANVYFGVRMKIQACGWLYYKTKEVRDSINNAKTAQRNDSFWKRDTITIVKRDTIRKTDTIVKYRNTGVNVDLKQKEEVLKKREAELNAKEADLRKRELELKNKAGDCKPCQDELIIVKQQLAEAKDQLNKVKLELDACNRTKAVIAAETNDIKKKNADLLAENDKLKKEIAVLKLNVNPCDKQVKSRDSLLAVERDRNARLAAELAKKNAACDVVQKELDITKKRVSVLEAEVADGKKRIAVLEADLANCKLGASGNNADCLNKVKQLEAQLAAEKLKTAALQKELIDAKVKVEVETKKNAQLLLDLDACQKAAAADKKRIADLEAMLKNNGDCGPYKDKIAQLEADIIGLKANSDKQVKYIAELEAKLKNCGNADELNKCKSDLDATKKRNAEIEAELASVKKQRDQYLLDLETYKKKVADLEAKLKDCEGKGTDCSACEEELAQQKIKYDQKAGAYDALMDEYKACTKDVAALKQKLADCEAKLKDCSGSGSKEKELQAEIDKLKLTIAELNAEVAARQKSLDELQDAYSKLENTNADLVKKVTGLQAEINGLKTQLGALQQQLKECQEAAGK